MSGEEPENVERLRAAFASVEGDEQERVDTEGIFDALHGTLDPEKRRAIVDELASNPGAAEAWRLARELAPEPGARGFEAAWNWRWLAVAAMLLTSVLATSPVVAGDHRSRSDVIVEWNALLQQFQGGQPFPQSRGYAMLHVAMADAVIDRVGSDPHRSAGGEPGRPSPWACVPTSVGPAGRRADALARSGRGRR